ncbi:MAG: nitrate- and nitrite sensing domain-containing protein [Actinobacteria bacterium]|nr:nitrate- and nitrite sensing domain-containing protein [Actinomycetota bacterium]
MGSRGRSIRLRIYFLVAIPLVAMVGLLAYVAGTSINNAVNLDRGPDLINATSLPTAQFVNYLQAERAAAVVYLFRPTPANLAAYQAAVSATAANKPNFVAAMNSSGTRNSEDAAEAQGIQTVLAGLDKLPELRAAVVNRLLTPLQALGAYSLGIQDEPKLFLAEADSLSNASAAGQALGMIAIVSAHEALSQEYALLSGVLAGQRITQADRAAFAEMVATRQGNLVNAEAILDGANRAIFNRAVSNATQAQVAQIEGAVSAGLPLRKLPVTLAQWQGVAGQLLGQYYTGGVNVAANQLVADRQVAADARNRVAITASIGLLGLLLTIAVTILVGRSIIRRLGGLERSALQLAEHQLPDVVARLRRGEDVDVNAEAPPLRVGGDEIGRVGQAFGLVRQTAIRAAVEEARLRHGLNDVFRSLARRSQSLLHRQLTLLDQMERRATDPEALDDLFRLDHLTTRMRRHAEGLVILAGAPPGRGWSSPVRMVDVMRGAIAEVEDYARVSVATRSQAALAGSAVADVIHLLAELVENATTLSPPYTSVRVSGESVANGFAIEVEDRGLGMSPQRLAELNERLASPPEFNPAESEQLGLFVVSQLAKRHGIRVTLRGSPYGGTSAIVLVPRHLMVTEEAFRPGLPGEPASISMARPAANGSHAAPAAAGLRPGPGFGDVADLPGLAQTPGIRISGPLRRSQGVVPERLAPGPHAGPALGPAAARPGELPGRHQDQPGTPAGTGAMPGGSAPPPFDVFLPRHSSGPPRDLTPDTGAWPAPGAPEPGSRQAGTGPDGDIKGLPRRVKQASLAPQLRADPPQRRTTMAGVSPDAGPTPAEIRQTVSALQRGWQEGRSQQLAGTAPGHPARVPPDDAGPGSPSGAGSPADTSTREPAAPPDAGPSPPATPAPASGTSPGPRPSGGHDPVADSEARGESDGS